MKFPVLDKTKRVGMAIVIAVLFAVLVITNVVIVVKSAEKLQSISNGDITPLLPVIIGTVLLALFAAWYYVFECANVLIDENGITLVKGRLRIKHINWEQIQLIEIVDLKKSGNSIIKVLGSVTEISFRFNSQAITLLQQRYRGEICYS